MRKIFLILLFFPLLVCSQQRKIDSLSTLVRAGKEDTLTVIDLKLLAQSYASKFIDSSFYFIQKSIDLAKKLNYKKGLAQSLNTKGVLYQNTSDYAKALSCYIEALDLLEQIKFKPGIASVRNNMGIIYDLQGNKKKAIEEYTNSMNIHKELGNKKSEAICLSNLGVIYADSAQYEKALDLYRQALELYTQLGDSGQMAIIYNNVGTVYGDQNQFKNAIAFYERSAGIREKLEDLRGLAECYYGIGECYVKIDQPEKAISFLERSLDHALRSAHTEMLKQGYSVIYKIYRKKKDFEKALYYASAYININDSMYNDEKTKLLGEMAAKYQTVEKDKELLKKEVELQRADAEKKENDLQRNGLIIGAILLLVLGLISFYAYINKRRSSNEIAIQKSIVEAKNKDILDSIRYAKRIQQSLLPTEKYIERNLKRLNK